MCVELHFALSSEASFTEKQLPGTGSAPYPAVIIIGGINSLSTEVLESEGVATLSFDHTIIASGAPHDYTNGKYYEVNPEYTTGTGALMAWSWGISRIIDMLEQNPDLIDPARIAVHGCLGSGKAAFVAGAFDQGIALNLSLEPGTGGPAPFRALSLSGGQTHFSASNEGSWFSIITKHYNSNFSVDMNDVAVLYAPRGLLIMDNPHVDTLSFKANYLGCAAAYEVYKAMGKADALWYIGNSDESVPCSKRDEYTEPQRAMIRKFLKGDASMSTGGLDIHDNHHDVDVASWIGNWNIGTILE